jgi:acyl carrier protein
VGPAAGPEFAIMDEKGEFLAKGETGEIVIRGPNVTDGYAGNPEANRTSFVNGWFRTGDQGYMDEDGYLFITGRIKELINRGGQKISPREVDEALLEHPAVQQAVTFAVPHPRLGEAVAAAVVAEPGEEPEEGALRRYLSRKLAPYKVPQQIVRVAAIPKGPSGKLQRIGLSDTLAPLLESDYEPPQGNREIRVAGIWQAVLPDCGRIGRQDNFFALGGDSLLAARIVSRLEEEFGVEVRVEDLFNLPVLHRFAAHLEQMSGDDDMAEMLGEIEGLSEEEAIRILGEQEDLPPPGD